MNLDARKLGPVAAVVTRGDGIEAYHSASVAVIAESGKLTHAFGDPELVSLARSALKPFQALALITSGAADAFGLGSEELAIACASHNGSDEHVAVVKRLLAMAGATASDLQCGAHLPIGLRIAERAPEHGEDKDPLRNACSGKHAGFLALSRKLGAPLAEYLTHDGLVQRTVRATLARALGVDAATLPHGIDGCSAPNYALSLAALGRGMLALVRPEHAPAELRAAFARVCAALLAHPRLVSGLGRLDYDLSRAFAGNAVCKVGAESMELMAFREQGIALALKVHDGAERALAPICISLLEQLGLANAPLPPELEAQRRPFVTNHRKIRTGEIVATLELERV